MGSDESLETPLLVNIAAGAVALAALFMCIMAAQFALSDAYGTASTFMVIYGVVGAAGLGMGAGMAKGRTWAAIGGVVASLAMLGLCWTPFLFGVLAFTSFAVGFCAFVGLILAGISIPMCLEVGRARKKFFEELEAG